MGGLGIVELTVEIMFWFDFLVFVDVGLSWSGHKITGNKYRKWGRYDQVLS
jgi:hypothetical protein